MKKSKLASYVNKQAIREILGSLLQDPSLIREYKIVQNDFPETFHKLIFAAINNLYKNGAEVIDAVAIDEYLSHYETQNQVFTKNEGINFLEKVQEMALQSNFKYTKTIYSTPESKGLLLLQQVLLLDYRQI